MGPLGNPVEDVKAIMNELASFSPELAQRDRWLVLNKVDLLPHDERDSICDGVCHELEWQGPVFRISALSGEGTGELVQEVMGYIESVTKLDDE